jgi:SAM-dependent methyltransferase
MLQWYRSQINQWGLLSASFLMARVRYSRARTVLANKLLPRKGSCPCCGWTGNRFYDYIEAGYTLADHVCPQCDSHSRHRALSVWLKGEYELINRRGTAIIFAPENALAPAWRAAISLDVIRVDIETARCPDLVADLQRLPIAANSASLIWCHHVLEHVKDDHAAISELYRILRPEPGELIVSVPMYKGEVTREYGFADPRESGHWRIYDLIFVTAWRLPVLTSSPRLQIYPRANARITGLSLSSSMSAKRVAPN